MDYGVTNSYGKPEKIEAFKILETAWESGIRQFDTAPAYGSEEILGEFININGIQNKVKVLTKIPSLKNEKNYQLEIKSSLESSLEKLNSEIEVLFFHNSEDYKLLLADEIFFKNIRINYPIKSLGVSVYAPNDVEPTLISEFNLACQFPANVLDRRFEKNIYPLGKRYCRSIFLQGILASKIISKKNIRSEVLQLQKDYHIMLEEKDINPIQFALSFIINSGIADYAIFGVDTVKQLKEIIGMKIYKKNKFEDEKLSFIEEYKDWLDPRNWNTK
jgi:aryl-alcohol dehydrogenase-like predicted oxidoreductase